LYGMVWYGMVWYGMVWYGMVWYGMVECRIGMCCNVWCGYFIKSNLFILCRVFGSGTETAGMFG
jgi:chloride channel 2